MRDQSPQPATSRNITVNHTFSVHSRDRERSADMEFEEFSGRDENKEKSDQIHKRFEITQDWSWLNLSSSTTSIVQLAR
jgi:hypothetical protein